MIEGRQLICNKAKCNLCGDVIISFHSHDFKYCSCGSVSVDGGRDYARRLFKSIDSFTELSVYSDDDFSLIRENLYRGSRGKNEDQPLTYICLKDIDNEYLSAIINYMEDMNQQDSIDYQCYINEYNFRIED